LLIQDEMYMLRSN